MPDKKFILLISLLLLAVGSFIYGIVTPSGVRRELSASSTPVSSSPSQLPKKPLLLERQAKRSPHISWGRNPFSLQDEGMQGRPLLNGIVWDEKSPQAVINDRIVQVGDKVGKNTVVSILPNRVVLNDGTQNFELRLGRKK